ncbi:unnamed protein product [Rotaria sordida]|uniref:Uncharacterized protein n=1 Tax=Rotaria sordida TaxID=392033 RepID=A0A813NT87_9BILA|nr:unnamed protein product [Rotaria sordida]CAF3666967.1 unnamed protein product [Rotaria sordida]
MYKKSIVRIENENQTDLNNPALNDIIATNHVVFTKKPHKERLSRACKAAILMLSLGLVAIGIIVLTLVLAHSRNTHMAVMSRSAETNFIVTSNNSRFLFVNQEDLTTITNEQTENGYWPEKTVILTSNNLHTLTTQNVDMSSSIMRTKQNEYIHPDTQSMKTYPSSNIIVNEHATISTTIQTTISNQQTTFAPSSHHFTTMMTTENELTTIMESQEYIEMSSNSAMTSIVESNSTLTQDNTTPMPEDTSSTIFINRYFNIESSTIANDDENKRQMLAKKNKNNSTEEDIKDDVLFS